MKKLLSYKLFLEEVELSLAQLAKVRGSETSGDALVRKIKDKDPEFTSNNNKSIAVDKMIDDDGELVDPPEIVDDITTDGSYDVDKAKDFFTTSGRYRKVFKDESGDEFALNQFKKTQEFGSSGAGRLTKEFESVQCIFLGIKQAYPDIALNSSNLVRLYNKFIKIPDNLVHLSDTVKVDQKLINDFLDDSGWVETFTKIPNRLWSRSGKYLDSNNVYSIYHVGYKGEDSPFNMIYKKYKEFAKDGGFSDINISKYCPADVYLVSLVDRENILNEIDNSNSIDEMNGVINKFFDEKILLPISLKKIHDSSFKIITNYEVGKNLPEFFIKSFNIGSDMRGIGSKITTTSIWKHRNDKDVDIKDRRINFDSSDTKRKQNVDGEIEGSSSRHGKVSFKAIKRILDSKIAAGFKIQNLQSQEELSVLNMDQLKSMVSGLISKVNSLKKDYSDNLIQVNPIERGSDITKSENKLISRIQSLQIVLAIIQLHGVSHIESNDVITKISRYALSIKTDKFETPRYLRIV